MRKFNVLRYIMFGLVGGALAFVVSKIFEMFNIPTYYWEGKFFSVTASTVDINLRQQILETGQFEQFGIRLIEFLQNTLSFNTDALFGVLLVSVLVVMAGRIVIGFSKKEGILQKFQVFFSYLIGSAIFAVIAVLILGLGFGIVPSIITYGGVVGLIVQIGVRTKKLTWLKDE